MIIYTIGFIQKSAKKFFETLRHHGIKILIDIRLRNKSQMSRFSYGGDDELGYLLSLINCEYVHKVEYAPTKKILDDYKNEKITWPEYEVQYNFLIDERRAVEDFITCFNGIYDSVCLLCAEPTPEQCHRRLFAQKIQERLNDVEIIHL